jgi:hypothetical protein
VFVSRALVSSLARGLLVAYAALAGAGCGGLLGEGKRLFKSGRYPEAKEALAQLEGQTLVWDTAERAEYALYRGLTLAALGDLGRAGYWLAEAKAIEDGHPGTLAERDALRLAVALAFRR